MQEVKAADERAIKEAEEQKRKMQDMNAQLQELRTDLQDTRELLQMMHKSKLNEREWLGHTSNN